MRYLISIIVVICAWSCQEYTTRLDKEVYLIENQFSFDYQNTSFQTNSLVYLGTDTITFVSSKNHSPLKENLLFIQGSLPVPVVLKISDSSHVLMPLSNIFVSKLHAKFNIFLLSKPFTPVVKSLNELNSNYQYVPDLDKPNCYDINYQRHNNLEYTSVRISFFIDFIQNKYPTKSNDFVVIGHSQGAIEAASVSKLNSNVSHCVYLSSGPLGRVQDQIMTNRINYVNGKIDSVEYILNKKLIYEYWKEVQTDSCIFQCEGDPNLTTKSFSTSNIPDLVDSKARVFIGIGSLDAGSYIVDLVPLYFIEKGKEIPKIKIYEGLEHNFFPILPNGTPDYKNGKWETVIDDVLLWLAVN